MASPDTVGDGGRKVYPVAAFNTRLRSYLRRVRGIWVEGELSELRRNEAWATVFFTLKDENGSTLRMQMPRARFDGLGLALVEGERLQVEGALDLWEERGQLVFRASAIERAGVGDQLAALERRKQVLAAEGLFDSERKRALPRMPTTVGLVTGADAAARGDVEVALAARFPAARLVIVETRVQGPRAAQAIVAALERVCRFGVEVVIVARGGGSFEDLLPFSDERVVRAFASCPIPIVSAVGHEQDTPLCDLAADVRAATPTAAVRLVVPDAGELLAALHVVKRRLDAALRNRIVRSREAVAGHRQRLVPGVLRAYERDRATVTAAGGRLRTAPSLILERRRAALDTLGVALQALSPAATLSRGYAVVRHHGAAIRDASTVAANDRLEIELASGTLTARVES